MLVLSEAVPLAQHPHIKPVCLPSPAPSLAPSTAPYPYEGVSGVVAGWGLTDYYNGTFPGHLRHTEVTVFGKKKVVTEQPQSSATIIHLVLSCFQCGHLTPILRHTQLCAGHVDGGRDACQASREARGT